MISPPHFGIDVARAALTLGSGLILGGAVKVALDHYQQSQEKREQGREARQQLVEELRDVRQRAEGARLMIKAHKTTESYAEQMSVLIDCHVTLLKLKHTLELLRGSTSGTDPRETCLDGIAAYLATLYDEYADNYCDLDYRQRYDRAVIERYLTALAATDTDFDANEVSTNQTWQLMRDKCPRLADLIDGEKDYRKKFRLPLRHLIRHLWSVREAKPDIMFDDRAIHEFESMLKDALDAVDDSPVAGEADDGVTLS